MDLSLPSDSIASLSVLGILILLVFCFWASAGAVADGLYQHDYISLRKR
jgi:hypothetical protein